MSTLYCIEQSSLPKGVHLVAMDTTSVLKQELAVLNQSMLGRNMETCVHGK